MAGVILAVTPNPAVDVTYHLDELRPGEVHRVADVVTRAGGKGVNVARVLARLGSRCEAVVVGSGGAAARIEAELGEQGVPVTLIGTMEVRRTVVVHAADGTTTSLWEPGSSPQDPAAVVDALLATVGDRLDADGPASGSPAGSEPGAEPLGAVTVSGSLPPGLPADLPARVAALATSRGLPAVLDLDGAALAAAVAGGTAVLTPNADELARLTRVRPGSVHEVTSLAQGLVATSVPMVVVTLGAEGLVVARRGGRAVHARLPEPVQGNATGAGDAVCAAVATRLAAAGGVDDADAAEVARYAVAVGAAAVLRPVAGEVDPDDVERLLGRVQVGVT